MNRSKSLLDKVTASDIAYTILVYENTKEVWEEDLKIKASYKNDKERHNATLAGKVANMSAICWPNSQMLALLADIPLSWRHKINPDTVFLCRGLPTFTQFVF